MNFGVSGVCFWTLHHSNKIRDELRVDDELEGWVRLFQFLSQMGVEIGFLFLVRKLRVDDIMKEAVVVGQPLHVACVAEC